jgi:hypothetical protein
MPYFKINFRQQYAASCTYRQLCVKSPRDNIRDVSFPLDFKPPTIGTIRLRRYRLTSNIADVAHQPHSLTQL